MGDSEPKDRVVFAALGDVHGRFDAAAKLLRRTERKRGVEIDFGNPGKSPL